MQLELEEVILITDIKRRLVMSVCGLSLKKSNKPILTISSMSIKGIFIVFGPNKKMFVITTIT